MINVGDVRVEWLGSYGTVLDGFVAFSIIQISTYKGEPGGYAIFIQGARATTLPGRYESVDAAIKSQEADRWVIQMLESGQ